MKDVVFVHKNALSYVVTAAIKVVQEKGQKAKLEVGLSFCSPEDLLNKSWDKKLGCKMAGERLANEAISIEWSRMIGKEIVDRAVCIAALMNKPFVPGSIRRSLDSSLSKNDSEAWQKALRRIKGKKEE